MSFEDIRIYRDIPIVNNYLALPPNREADKNAFYCGGDCSAEAQSLLPDSGVVQFGTGQETGGKNARQRWLRLPFITPNSWYTSDPVEDLGSNIIDNEIDIQTDPGPQGGIQDNPSPEI
jgi:hypothetical protein